MAVMKRLLTALLFFLVFAPLDNAGAKTDFNFRFALIADPHIDHNAKDKPDYFKLLNQSTDLLKIAIAEINALNQDAEPSNDIDFVLFCGDNINSSSMADYKLLSEILHELDAPFFMVPGDWDYKPDYSPPTISQYFPLTYENLNENVMFDDSAYPGVRKYDFSLDFTNSDSDVVHIIGMDNVLHFNGDRGSFESEQIEWLEDDLKRNSSKPVIVFQHCPVITPVFKSVNTPIEDVEWIPYTNKSGRENPKLSETFVMHYPWWVNKAADKSEEFLSLMEQYKVPLVLMGDYHLNKKVLYPDVNPTSMLAINPALVSYPCAYTIYSFDESAISWEVRQIEKYADKCREYDKAGIERYNKMFGAYGASGMKWDIEITMGLSWGSDDGETNDWSGVWEYGGIS